jgi:ethylbenzene dioxygenase ferredoxin subunit
VTDSSATNQRVFLLNRAELPAGQARRVRVAPDCPVAVYNLDGRFYATHDVCTHATASLARGDILDGDVIACPVHDGQFHIPTGRAVGFPCTVDLRTYRIVEEGNAIYADLAHESDEVSRSVA